MNQNSFHTIPCVRCPHCGPQNSREPQYQGVYNDVYDMALGKMAVSSGESYS